MNRPSEPGFYTARWLDGGPPRLCEILNDGHSTTVAIQGSGKPLQFDIADPYFDHCTFTRLVPAPPQPPSGAEVDEEIKNKVTWYIKTYVAGNVDAVSAMADFMQILDAYRAFASPQPPSGVGACQMSVDALVNIYGRDVVLASLGMQPAPDGDVEAAITISRLRMIRKPEDGVVVINADEAVNLLRVIDRAQAARPVLTADVKAAIKWLEVFAAEDAEGTPRATVYSRVLLAHIRAGGTP